MQDWDVIVVGGGNAALCAALSAREDGQARAGPRARARGRKPAAIRASRGAPAHRHNGAEDLRSSSICRKKKLSARISAPTPPTSSSTTWRAVTEYRCDPDLTEILVKNKLPGRLVDAQARRALHRSLGRQAFKIDGRFKFWGGLTLEAIGGGPGLIESLTQIAKKNGVEVWYQARAVSLIADDAGRARRWS